MFTILVVLLITFYIYFRVHRYYKYDIYFKDIPSEFSYPFLGNAFKLGFNSTDYLKNLTIWWQKFGFGMFRIDVGPKTLIVITDPDDVEVILSSTTHINKMDEYKYFYPWLGDGLLTTSGQKWHSHRKMITPSFHFKILNNFLYTINENSTKFVEILKVKANGETFDCQPDVGFYSMDVICETSMGVKVNAMNNHDSKLIKYYHELCQIIIGRFFSSVKQVEWLFRLTSDYRKLTKTIKYIHDYNENVMLKRREDVIKEVKEADEDNYFMNDDEFSLKKRKAFLDNLLTSTIDGQPLTNKQISEEVSTFIFAGRDTTSSGIAFALYCLSLHAEYQQKVFDELFSIFGNDTSRSSSFKEIQEMDYLEMFLKESMRLYTNIPFIGRRLSEMVEMNGRKIPADTNIIIFLFGMHLNPKVFPEPEKFMPERFLLKNRSGKHPYEYVPFSAGPRNCIGQKFAMLEIKSVISAIVRNFVILPSEDNNYKPILATSSTLKSVNGLMIKLKPRVYDAMKSEI